MISLACQVREVPHLKHKVMKCHHITLPQCNPGLDRRDEYDGVMVRIAAQIDTASTISLCLTQTYHLSIEIHLSFHVFCLQSNMRNLLDVYNRHNKLLSQREATHLQPV